MKVHGVDGNKLCAAVEYMRVGLLEDDLSTKVQEINYQHDTSIDELIDGDGTCYPTSTGKNSALNNKDAVVVDKSSLEPSVHIGNDSENVCATTNIGDRIYLFWSLEN